MRIVDAFWEKRNLGVSCYELQMETNDILEQVINEYQGLEEKQYMVARIPSARYDLVQYFQSSGFQFIEAAITLRHDLQNISIPRRLLRICEKCSWAVMDSNDIQQLYEEIEKGIFKTDRIYIDPNFSKKQAAQRYVFWIQDLVKQGNIPYKVSYSGEVVGFFLNKEKEVGVYDGLLAATYSAFEGTGMGYCIQYAGMQSVIERNAKEYIGHISGNNPKVMHVLLSIGFSIDKIDYILIKHSKGE